MEVFVESGLTFCFSSSHWAVRKYDSHEYYQAISGAGLKGMDFVGIWKGRQLVLIEAKNYLGVSKEALPKPDALAEEMLRKVEDTFIGLNAIHRMLARKSFFRLVRPLLIRFPIYSYDWPFWAKVDELAEFIDSTQILLVLQGYPEELHIPFAAMLTEWLADNAGTIDVISAGQPTVDGLSIR